MNTDRKKTQSIDSQILAAIKGRGLGSVFVPADFLEKGSREAVDIVLHRLLRKGTIRRLAPAWMHPIFRELAEEGS